MNDNVVFDEQLLQRLPLPLAQLCRRSLNAQTPLERHNAAFYVWEAALKLLGSVAVVEYANLPEHDQDLVEQLKSLARPSLGHWCGFVRNLVPILARHKDLGFTATRDLLIGRPREDLPRAAGLDAGLLESFEGRATARSTVRLLEMFDHLVQYRNREIGHGASGQRSREFYDKMSRSLLAAAGEVLGRLDILAGRRLLSVGDVRRQSTGSWLIDRYVLTGETPKRLESLEYPEADTAQLPRPLQVYLEEPAGRGRPGANLALSALHPLLLFDVSSGLVYFLSARRGERAIEYLCYTSGATIRRERLHSDHRALMARVLGQPVLEQAAEEWAAASMSEEPAAPPRDPEGASALRTIGEFQLLSRLGRGGMGVVYRAWQPSLERQVALKCMLRAGDPKADKRFLREIHALGRVEHPNVVKVFTSGSDGDQCFYAMELIEGAELARVCAQLAGSSTAEIGESHWRKALSSACDEVLSQETPLSDTEVKPRRPGASVRANAARDDGPIGARGHVTLVAEIMRSVACATHALHEAGVIHRDIKPANIMLTADTNHPVLMDLGLAQLADEAEGRLTRTRQFLGTLRYASPEQVYEAGRVDRRTDIYSLGATLWELLTLRPIFDAGDETTTPDLMLKIQTTDPGTPRKYNKHVPRDLEAIVLKCLEKDRTRRYPTADELAVDLGRFLSGEPVSAQPPSLTYLSGKFIRRYRTALGVAAVVLAVLLGGAVAAFIGIDRERRRVLAANDQLQEQLYDNHIAVAERELTQKNDIGRAGELLENCPEKLRGWEWRYLMRLRDGQRTPLEGHKSGLWGAEFSPDGKSIATASIDGTAKIWDTDTGQLRYNIDADKISLFGISLSTLLSGLGISRIPITCLDFSPDGRQLATGSFAPPLKLQIKPQDLRESRGLVRIWDVATGQMVSSFQEQLGVVLSLTYSPDGQRIASSSINPDNTFVVWNVKSGQVIQVVRGHTSHVHRLRFSPDGRVLAAAETDGVVKLWDSATFEEILSISAHPAPVVGIAFEPPNGARFATAGEDGTLRVWETATGRRVLELKGHTGSALDVRYSPDGQRIASAGFDKTVRVWDSASGNEKLTLRGHQDTVWGVAFSPDGEKMVSASFDHTARIWDATPREEQKGPGLFTIAGPGDHRVNSVAFSADGRYLASGSWDKEVHLRDGATGELIRTFKGHSLVAWGIDFSPDGKRLASASWDHKVKVWNTESGEAELTFSKHTAPVHSVAFSPDGKRLVSGGFDGQVMVWDSVTGTVTAHCDGFVFPILSVAFSPDGKRVASGGADRAVKVWDADQGKLLLTLKAHDGAVHGLSFSPDGKRLASASWDHTLRIWNVDLAERRAIDAREMLILKQHGDRVYDVAFSPDGQRIASASEDKTVRVYDAGTGEEVMPARLHRGLVWSVVFSPDGKRLAAGCWADSSWVKTWNAE